MKICLVDAWSPEDAALVNSHWVAERTHTALRQAHAEATLEMISGDEVDAAAVDVALSSSHEGFVYFGHGREDLLYRRDAAGEPIPLFGSTHLARLGARWFHAFACRSGLTLCRDAASAGAAAYLGYCVEVVVEWEVSRLPPELIALLEDLVTVATLLLASGERSRVALRRRVRDASDRLLEWLDTNEEASRSVHLNELMGLHMLANQLHETLALEGTAVLP
jgi:hypothetical protein